MDVEKLNYLGNLANDDSEEAKERRAHKKIIIDQIELLKNQLVVLDLEEKIGKAMAVNQRVVFIKTVSQGSLEDLRGEDKVIYEYCQNNRLGISLERMVHYGKFNHVEPYWHLQVHW